MFDYLRYLWGSFRDAVGFRFFGTVARVSDWIPFWLTPGFYGFLLTYPFRAMISAWEERHWRNLVWGLPAVAAVILVGWLNQGTRRGDQTIADRYWQEARIAMASEDYGRSQMLLDRVMRENMAHVDEARFALASIYMDTGNVDRAELLFAVLAPDNQRGLPSAHRRRAMFLCESLTSTSAKNDVKRALHHLEGSFDKETPEMLLAWGRYAIAAGDLDQARVYLEKVAPSFPEVWATLGTIYVELGREEQARSSYSSAKTYLGTELKKGPDNRVIREDYASVLMRLGELNEARQVLEAGLENDPTGNWKALLAGLYVNIHDLMALEGGRSVSELFGPLSKSLEYEPNFVPALGRLMAYASADVAENQNLRSILSGVLAEAKEPALAHLALGNVCWMEKDTDAAKFHFERAVTINKKLTVVLNNLAWIVAHDEQSPDPERALGLIASALELEPNNPRFLDTRGTILMKQERWKEAVTDLEASMDAIPDKSAVHGKLATVYEHLNFPEIASQHRQLEQKLREESEREQRRSRRN